MILECTECHARYLVPDSAIGATGRTVRCANCRHSWFQEPAILDLESPALEPAAPPPVAAAPVPQPIVAPIAAPAPAEEALARPSESADFSAFAPEPPFRARRNPARRWTIAAVAVGAVMLAAVVGLFFTDVPGIAAQLGLTVNGQETPLQFVHLRKPERREMPSGSELFVIGGQIHNPTAKRQPVPEVRAELRDAQNRMVYSWTIPADQTSIAPGGTIGFDSAAVDVPPSSREVHLSFAATPRHN
jgi:predicted Zn finger-like uncharacterized protein